MPNRRDILQQTCALALAASGAVGSGPRVRAASAVLPRGGRLGIIRSAVRRDDTILRPGGMGDCYDMTWCSGDEQLVAVNEGTGWMHGPDAFYESRLWAIRGNVRQAEFSAVEGYPGLSDSTRPDDASHYYAHGLLAARGRVFQFLTTLDRARDRPRHWVGAKLIYSDDRGRTWRNQDGTYPVVWEDWNLQSRERLVFFRESDESFSLLSVLQMGCDYAANRDGYVYVYGLNGNVDGRMNELVMFRVRLGGLLDRRAYEYFGGRCGDGRARWVRDIESRAVVHTFPRGWVNRKNLSPDGLVEESWLPSVVYNEPLGLYLMASAGVGCAANGTEYGKPSYLGFWVSSTPWGPWRQIHEETAWMPGGEAAARAYGPRIAPQWIAGDGRSFWLVWADCQGIASMARDQSILDEDLRKAGSPQARGAVMIELTQRYIPRYAFNAQRVDLR